MQYVEEREFVLRLELRCPFPDDYEGEEDGYVWVEGFAPIARQIVEAAVRQIHQHPGWRVRPINRGRPAGEEVSLVVEKTLPLAEPSK